MASTEVSQILQKEEGPRVPFNLTTDTPLKCLMGLLPMDSGGIVADGPMAGLIEEHRLVGSPVGAR